MAGSRPFSVLFRRAVFEELFLTLAGVLVTCYLAALGLHLGAGVAARIQLGPRIDAI